MLARENPFRSDLIESLRYEMSAPEWDDLFARFHAYGRRGALVGPEGVGKTTLLEDLAPHLRQMGLRPRFIGLNRHQADWKTLLDGLNGGAAEIDAILLDGAEQLSRLQWLYFRWRTRRAGAVVITSHVTGLLPTLRACPACETLFGDFVAHLSGNACAGIDLGQVFRAHRGNMREAFRTLYLHAAGCADAGQG